MRFPCWRFAAYSNFKILHFQLKQNTFDGRRKISHFYHAVAQLESSFQGKLILDSGKLAGSYFDRTVILICRHDESGAFGLALNRPLKHTLGSVMGEPLVDELARASLYSGGPVQPEALSFLHETESRPEFDILTNLTLGHSLEELKKGFSSPELPMRVRAYAGYSGWSAGQLDHEMKAGCWITHPASVSLVFSPEPEILWQRVLKEKGGLYCLIADCPADPALN